MDTLVYTLITLAHEANAFHRLYMARWCIKVRRDGTMATLARQHKCLVSLFLDFRKVGKFATFTERPKAKKCFSFRGLCPSDQGLCPWTMLGFPPPDPCYRLALRGRHGLPPNFQILFAVSASEWL